MIHRFEDFEFDEARRELRRAGQVITLQPKAFKLLGYLLAHRDRLVTKAELLTHVWPDETASEGSLTFCVNLVRKAVGDDGTQRRIIKAVRGQGYQIVTAVHGTPATFERAAQPAKRPAGGSPFFGRGEQREEFLRRLDAQQQGHGAAVFFAGEAGIGKTRLMLECARLAEQRGALVLEGRCYHGDGALPFWPWVELVRGYAQQQDSATLEAVMGPGAADLTHLVPSLRERLSAEPPPLVIDSDQARLRLFESLGSFWLRAARHQPLVLRLDDLQWADRSSIVLLRYVARDIARAPLLLLGAYRDDEVDDTDGVARACDEVVRAASGKVFRLPSLEPAEARDLLTTAAGRQDLSPSFVAAVAARSDGNPFFVEELARNVVAQFARAESNPELAAQASLDRIPSGIRNLVAERIVRLSEPARRLLAIASVVGRQVPLVLLEQVASDFDRGSLPDTLDECVRGHVLVENDAARAYSFVHALIHETLYHQLSTPRRSHLHRRVAACLEALGPDSHAAEIARHSLLAIGEAADLAVVPLLVRAARQATLQFAHDDAARWLERAVAITAHDAGAAPTLRCDLLLDLGSAVYRAGDIARSRRVFEQAAAAAREFGDVERFTRAALGAVSQRPTVDPVAVDLLAEALGQLDASRSTWRARVLARIAGRSGHTPGSWEIRRAYCTEAVDLARASGDREVLGSVLQDVLPGMLHLDSGPQVDLYADELLALGDSSRAPQPEMTARVWRVMRAMESGEVPRMDAEISTYRARATELREPIYLANAAIYEAARALVAGDLEHAEMRIEQAHELGRRLGEPQNAMVVFVVQGAALLRLRGGSMAAAEAFIELAKGEAGGIPLRWAVPLMRLDDGREREARAAFDEIAANDFSDLPLDRVISGGTALSVLIAEACARLGDQRRSQILYHRLLPYADRWVVASLAIAAYGSVSRYLGLLAATLERWPEAQSHFEQALAAHALSPSELALTYVDFAWALLRRAGHGDRDQAGRAIDHAARLAKRHRLGAVTQRLERLSSR